MTIFTVGWQNPSCCKCPQALTSTGGQVEACGYDLNDGHIVWGWNDTSNVCAGAGYVFTPEKIGGSLDRIGSDGSREEVDASQQMDQLRCYGEAGDGTLGAIGESGTSVVYCSDLSFQEPTFTTEAANTQPFSKIDFEDDRNAIFGDTMYLFRDLGVAFEYQIERTSDGTTMTGHTGSSSMFTVPANNSTYFLHDTSNKGGVFYGTFGDPFASWTEVGSGLDQSLAKLTDNHFVWYRASGIGFRCIPLTDASDTTNITSKGNYGEYQVLGDKVLVTWWYDDPGGPGGDKITLELYSDDGTLDWSKEISNNVAEFHKVCAIGASGGDIILQCNRTTGTGSGWLLRRYSLSDGSLQWAVRADEMPYRGLLQANNSLGQVVSSVISGATTWANSANCTTTVDDYAESVLGA